MIDYNNDFWSFMADHARKKNIRDKDEIDLYEKLNMALELDEDESYHVVGSGIGEGLFFHVTTQYPDGLPDNIGAMFFNVSTDFNVKVQETTQCASSGERLFEVNLKKV